MSWKSWSSGLVSTERWLVDFALVGLGPTESESARVGLELADFDPVLVDLESATSKIVGEVETATVVTVAVGKVLAFAEGFLDDSAELVFPEKEKIGCRS